MPMAKQILHLGFATFRRIGVRRAFVARGIPANAALAHGQDAEAPPRSPGLADMPADDATRIGRNAPPDAIAPVHRRGHAMQLSPDDRVNAVSPDQPVGADVAPARELR